MAVKLNTTGYKHALKLISQGNIDAESDWSFTADDGNKLLEKGGWKEYKKWFLGYDPDVENEETKQHWKYPLFPSLIGRLKTQSKSLIAFNKHSGW